MTKIKTHKGTLNIPDSHFEIYEKTMTAEEFRENGELTQTKKWFEDFEVDEIMEAYATYREELKCKEVERVYEPYITERDARIKELTDALKSCIIKFEEEDELGCIWYQAKQALNKETP